MRAFRPTILVVAAGCISGGDAVPSFPDRRLNVVEDLRIGSVDDPQYALTRIRDMEVSSTGRIYSLHAVENSIRVHDPDGSFVRTIGRKGDGPGEFDNPITIGILGDTLWVLDIGHYRFSYFTLAGELLDTRRIPIDLGTFENSPPRPRGLLSDGSLVGASPAWSRLVADGSLTTQEIVRLDSAGAVVDTVATYPLANTVWQLRDPNRPNQWSIYLPQPFVDTDIVRISDYGPLIYHVRRPAAAVSSQGVFGVTVTTFDNDTVLDRQYQYLPVPVSAALVDTLIDRLAGFAAQRGRATQAQAEQWARDALYLPPHHPPVSELVIGRDGSAWLRGPVLSGAPVEWRVVLPDGEALGIAVLPARLTLLWVDGTTAYGMELDELDVPYIVRYRVEN